VEEALRANEEWQRANEDLRRMFRDQPRQESGSRAGRRRGADPRPFSQAIMEEPIPPNIVIPKMPPFSRVEDPKTYLKIFQTQMLILGGLGCSQM